MLPKLIRSAPRALHSIRPFGAQSRLVSRLTQVPTRFFGDEDPNCFEFKQNKEPPCVHVRAHCSKELQSFVQMFESNKQIHQKVVKGLSELCKTKEALDKIKKEKQMLADINEQNEHKLGEIQAMIEQQEIDATDIAKRLEGELQKTKAYAVTGMSKDALEIIDNFERSIKNLREGAFNGKPGVNKVTGIISEVHAGLESTLKNYGIRKMDAKIGDIVDPNFHHIIAFIPMPDKKNDEILEVTQIGYMIGERVLRAAKVVVIKN